MRVLIIDDSELIRNRLVELIENNQNVKSIELTSDSIDAMESFYTFFPNIVILDIRIPGGNGFRILKEIRKANKRVKIIILSDSSISKYISTCVEFGADYYLDKGVEFNLIPGIIRRTHKNLTQAI